VIAGPGGVVLLRGTHEFEAENLTAYEVGYRVQPASALSVDATFFHHVFDDLRSQDLPPDGGFPITIGNTLDGRSRGLEFGLNVMPMPRWRTHVGYTWLDTDISRQPGSRDIGAGVSEANDPHHLFNLRSSLDLARGIELDALMRSIGELPNPVVPAYTELTLRIGWHVTPAMDVWLVGQDLLHEHHAEAGADPGRVEFERAIRAGITVRLGR
jgi:iron complex outermembrane receptor protein